MPGTEVGIDLCPICPERAPTEYAALVSTVGKGGVTVEPHQYYVCGPCYKRQWAVVYGEMFGGISYDAYIKGQKQGKYLGGRF